MASKDLRDAQITITDGTAAPGTNTLTITADEGDLSFTQPLNTNWLRNRGVLAEVQDGDEEPVDVTFSFFWGNELSDPVAPTPRDALMRVGAAAAWASTRPAGEKYSLTLQLIAQGHGGNLDEIIEFEGFTVTSIEHAEDTERNRVSVTGQAFGVSIRESQS